MWWPRRVGGEIVAVNEVRCAGQVDPKPCTTKSSARVGQGGLRLTSDAYPPRSTNHLPLQSRHTRYTHHLDRSIACQVVPIDRRSPIHLRHRCPASENRFRTSSRGRRRASRSTKPSRPGSWLWVSRRVKRRSRRIRRCVKRSRKGIQRWVHV